MTTGTDRLPRHVRAAVHALDELVERAPGGRSVPALDGVPLVASRADELARTLYASWYVVWTPRDEPPVPDAMVVAPPHALRAAHPAARRLDPGWTVRQASSAGRAVVVDGDGGQRLLDRSDLVVPARPARHGMPGDAVAVTGLLDEVDEDGGFWLAYHRDWGGHDSLLRCYWRIAPAAAPTLVALLGEALADVPHVLKLAATWEGYARADAAVLYLPRDAWTTAGSAVARVASALAGSLTGEPPRCTRPLAPGLGIADGAAEGTSFGQHRCALVVDALLAWAADTTDRPMVAHLDEAFTAAGLRLAAPHLAAGATDVDWPPPAATSSSRRPAPTIEVAAGTAPAPEPDEDLRRAAVALADRLCDDAVWHEGRCTWLGAASRQVDGTWRPVVATAGSDLYEGTAGIGWLLAEVAASTADQRHTATALGALRYAAAHAPEQPAGMYTGLDGIALAAAGIARATGTDEAAAVATSLRVAVGDRLMAATTAGSTAHLADQQHDLLAGTAGTLLAALSLGVAPPPVVHMLVGVLDRAAVDQPVGVAWPDPHARSTPPLCGLAHGAAGVALALLEVDPVTEPRARPLARAAMAYEQSWFDREAGEWPDLREFDRAARRTGQRPATVTYWCHGALGIGLQRLRAWELTGDPALLCDVSVALQRAGELAGRLLEAGPDADPWSVNVSACHGASAVTGLFTTAGVVLRDPDLVDAGRRVAAWMVDAFAGAEQAWPCGVAGGGQTPGLALGLAGVAWTLLQAADPAGFAPLGLLGVRQPGVPDVRWPSGDEGLEHG